MRTSRPRSATISSRTCCCDSPDRARLIAELLDPNPGMGDLLADLEADDDLRAKFEMELLSG